MPRRFGYLTAGGRPGDLLQAFWAPRSHYEYIEVTAPQSPATMDRLRAWCPDATLFYYTDLFYPGAYEEVADTWRKTWAPRLAHPGWLRDLNGNRILRFGRGFFLPRQSTVGLDARLGADPIRMIADAHRAQCVRMGAHVRCDNLSPTIGWDLAGHKRVKWYGEERTREEIATAYTRIATRAIDAMTASLSPWGLIASSGERWPNATSAKLCGRLQESGITAASFAAQPLRADMERFNLALCYPKTIDSVLATFSNPRLQPSVVVVEHHDLGGKVLGV